ncbi:MAG: hypothetical protein CL401_04100 [Acidiferrobacteraceae bacterium]|nr:hypothetical protein [Acidiferrobacteraceae bacterium]
MPFRSYDTLRVFTVVARHESVTAAAQELNLSKASVSYQIRKLEDELGFAVIRSRQPMQYLCGPSLA